MFVRNLPFDASEQLLWDTFPTAKDVRVPVEPSGKNRGYVRHHVITTYLYALLA